jgi:hypothetical protein
MRRRLASPARSTTPVVSIVGRAPQVDPSGALSTCRLCGRSRPDDAYAGWGLTGGLLGRLCGARSACDDCVNELTQFPADMPMPVVLVEGSRVSGDPAVWRISA